STQTDVKTLLGESLLGFLGNLIIGGRQELVHGFDDGHFRTQTGPLFRSFQADHARADHAQLGRSALEIQRTSGVDDDVLIDRSRRDVYWLRARGQDHVLGCQDFNTAVELGDFNLLARQQLAVTFEQGHAIALDQRRNTAGEVFDDYVLAADHRRYVHVDVTGGNAVNLEAFAGFMELVGAVQQRLGRNAAYVQAGATQGGLAFLALVLFDQSSLQTQLSSPNRSHIAARARTDYNDVEFLTH